MVSLEFSFNICVFPLFKHKPFLLEYISRFLVTSLIAFSTTSQVSAAATLDVSSAYRLIVVWASVSVSLVTLSGRSAVKSMNRGVPRTEPCLTPYSTSFVF